MIFIFSFLSDRYQKLYRRCALEREGYQNEIHFLQKRLQALQQLSEERLEREEEERRELEKKEEFLRHQQEEYEKLMKERQQKLRLMSSQHHRQKLPSSPYLEQSSLHNLNQNKETIHQKLKKVKKTKKLKKIH